MKIFHKDDIFVHTDLINCFNDPMFSSDRYIKLGQNMLASIFMKKFRISKLIRITFTIEK